MNGYQAKGKEGPFALLFGKPPGPRLAIFNELIYLKL
jgi:hypothetical protein